MLPEQSRTAKRQSPELQWSQTDYLLWRVEHQLRVLSWMLSDEKKRPKKPPQALKTPGQLAEATKKQANALANKAEINKILGIEVDDGD